MLYQLSYASVFMNENTLKTPLLPLVVCGKQNNDYPLPMAKRRPVDVCSTAAGRLTIGRMMPSCPTSLECLKRVIRLLAADYYFTRFATLLPPPCCNSTSFAIPSSPGMKVRTPSLILKKKTVSEDGDASSFSWPRGSTIRRPPSFVTVMVMGPS